jgi:hypothetical protein
LPANPRQTKRPTVSHIGGKSTPNAEGSSYNVATPLLSGPVNGFGSSAGKFHGALNYSSHPSNFSIQVKFSMRMAPAAIPPACAVSVALPYGKAWLPYSERNAGLRLSLRPYGREGRRHR